MIILQNSDLIIVPEIREDLFGKNYHQQHSFLKYIGSVPIAAGFILL